MPEIKQIHERAYLIEVSMEEYDVRGLLLLGDKYALIWDSLSHPDDMQAINPLLGDMPFYLVYSHADWDHIYGNAGLERQPVAIIAHETASPRFSADVPQTLAKKRAEVPHYWDAVRLDAPNIIFDSFLSLDLGGITCELHSLAGHTEDCIVAFIPELGMWLGGDTIETPMPVIELREPVQAWAEKLKQWSEDERIQTVIPAHGAIGKRDEIRKTYDYLATLLDGKSPIVPDNLADFYRQTHADNLKIMLS